MITKRDCRGFTAAEAHDLRFDEHAAGPWSGARLIGCLAVDVRRRAGLVGEGTRDRDERRRGASQDGILGHRHDVLDAGLGIESVQQVRRREAAVEAHAEPGTRKCAERPVERAAQEILSGRVQIDRARASAAGGYGERLPRTRIRIPSGTRRLRPDGLLEARQRWLGRERVPVEEVPVERQLLDRIVAESPDIVGVRVATGEPVDALGDQVAE